MICAGRIVGLDYPPVSILARMTAILAQIDIPKHVICDIICKTGRILADYFTYILLKSNRVCVIIKDRSAPSI